MDKRLEALLRQHQAAITGKWFDVMVKTYPPDTALFLANKADRFDNPVGHAYRNGLKALFEAILNQAPPESLSLILDPMIRIRAVQSFSPSQAIAFIFHLKTVIRDLCGKALAAAGLVETLPELESDIDTAGLLAFDVFMACREKIYEIKATDERQRTYRAFDRAGLLRELPAETVRGA